MTLKAGALESGVAPVKPAGFGAGLPSLFPDLTWQCNPQVERLVASAGPDAVVVDLGAGGRRIAPQVKTVDFADHGETDYVCDVAATPFDDGSVDLVIAAGVIEHVEDEAALLVEARRILKPGGRLHIEVPFLQQYHAAPIDCRRYTAEGLQKLLVRNGFAPEAAGFHIGPSVAIATLNAYYAALLFEGEGVVSRVLSNGAFLAASIVGWPLKFLDRFLKTRKSAHRLAFGVYCTAKSPAPASVTDEVI